MKKCPYCAGELEDTVIVCHHCGKSINTKKVTIASMAKDLSNKEFNLADIFRYLNFIFITIAILTFFLPFAKFQAPIVGSQSISGFGVLYQSFNSQKEIQSQAGAENTKMGINSLKDMSTNNDAEKCFREKPIYRFIPIGLFCGLLAYISLIILVLWSLLKKPLLSFFTAMGSFIFSICFMISFFLLDGLLHYKMSSSTQELKDNPFAGLATLFTQGVKIEPAIAIYLLIITTFFICIFSRLEHKYNV